MAKENKKTEELLIHLNLLIDFWSKIENKDPKFAIDGVISTFLVMIDGGHGTFPEGMDLIDRKTGETISNGYLHEILQNYKTMRIKIEEAHRKRTKKDIN